TILTGALLANLALLEHIAHADVSQPAATAVPALKQDPAWLAEKQAFRVQRVIRPGENVLPPSCFPPCYAYPPAFMLDTDLVANTLESGPEGTDAAGRDYVDRNMTKLCGPGAAANSLAFWNDDIRHAGTTTFTDTSNGVKTTWDARRNRSYLLYLA